MTTGSAGARAIVFTRSIVLLLAVAVGGPAVLTWAARRRFGGPAPWHGVAGPAEWEWDRVRSSLTDRLTDQTLADVVVRVSLVVAWVAIAVFVSTVVAEAVHMARHDGLHLPDIRGLGVSQRSARVIAAGVLVVLPLFSSPGRSLARSDTGRLALERTQPAAIVLGADGADPAGGGSNWVEPGSAWPSSTRPRAAASLPGTGVGDDGVTRYVVRAGDSVYGIASRVAGPDPVAVTDYAELILDLNLGRDMGDGERFTNPAYIDVGWVLELPPSSRPSGDQGTDRSRATHTVEPGESLWTIADEELGAGERWRELYEANRGQVFDDGRRLDDPSLIHPGWDLRLPDGASVDPSPPANSAIDPATIDPATIDPATIEPATVHDSHHRQRTLDDGVDDGADSGSGDQDDARPLNVWIDRHDAPDTSPPTAPAAAPSSPPSTNPAGDSALPADEVAAPELLTLQRAAMLSAGVLTLLAVRRRNRLRRARAGVRVPAPSPRQAATERTLRATGAGERIARVDVAVRAAAMALIAGHQRVLAVLSATDGELELIATGAAELPGPWIGSGDRWTLAAATPIELLAADARRVAAPCPTLVQLGTDEAGRDVYVDLEAIGALEIGGPSASADAIVAAIAATLSASVLAEVTTLIGLEVPTGAFLGHRLHRTARDAQHALEIARAAVGSTAASASTTFELRARATSGEAWEPAVVLAGSAADTLAASAGGAGVALVSAAPIEGASSRLTPDGATWVLRPVGIRLRPIGLAATEITAIDELVDVDRDVVVREGRLPPEIDEVEIDLDHVDRGLAAAPDTDRTIYVRDDDWTDDDWTDDERSSDPGSTTASELDTVGESGQPDWDLLVRVLGPVEVVDRQGAPVAFERSKTRELVAWLATHRDRATRTGARTALWEQDVRDATFANVVSEARRALARLVPPPDGEEWVGRTMSEALPLHPRVRTDVDLVELALAAARAQPPTQAIATLRPAVDLIVGMPFEGTTYLWPDTEGLTTNLTLIATSAAAEMAAHCLSVGDIEGVFHATGRGLRVLTGHEELIGLRMQAHARTGDHAGVRREWESYERTINADPWSDGEPSPKLVDLRKQLLNPGR